MADNPFSFATGEEQVQMAEGSRLDRMEQLMEQRAMDQQRIIEELRTRLEFLRGEASTAVGNLDNRLNQTLHQAHSNPHGTTERKPNPKPPRVQRFRGANQIPHILEWIHQAETYLKATGLENSESGLWQVTSFFEADAAVWWRLYCQQGQAGLVVLPKVWNDLKPLMIAQFQVFNHQTDIRDRYQSLRQTGSVNAYITKFRALVVELEEEPEANKVYQFLKGLKPEIQARTRVLKPTSLMTAMDIADEADRADYHARGGKFFTAKSIKGASGSGPAPMQIGVISANADRQRMLQQNRCFYCRKEGHQARDCRKKKMDMGKTSRRGTDQGWDETNTTGTGGQSSKQRGRKGRRQALN